MKGTLLAILIILFSINGYSTETIELFYNLEHIDMIVTYNEGNYHNGDRIKWYYDGLSKQLNDYIDHKISNKQIDDRKFNISIWLFPLYTCDCCPLQLSRSQNGYYIDIVDKQLNLFYLSRIVDYFAHPDWESFVCKEPKRFQNVAFNTIDTKINSIIPEKVYNFYTNKITTVFQIGDLAIDYEKDSLILKFNKKTVDININFKTYSIIPKRINDFYFIADDDSIYVIENMMIINSYERPLAESSYIKIEAYSEWMNYCDGGIPVLSYSTKRNKFYKIKHE